MRRGSAAQEGGPAFAAQKQRHGHRQRRTEARGQSGRPPAAREQQLPEPAARRRPHVALVDPREPLSHE